MLEIKDLENKIICDDCLNIMKQLPDKCIDLVLCDPPYGIGRDKWDENIPDKIYFDEIFRVSKNQVIFGGNYFNLPHTEAWICWDKMFSEDVRGKKISQNGFPRENISEFELVWTSLKIKPKIIRYTNIGNLQGFNDNLKVDYSKGKKKHITEKPIKLIQKLISDYSNENDLILDPFLGSGTTAVACKNLGRRFIGIEISPEYCRISEDRLKQEVLF